MGETKAGFEEVGSAVSELASESQAPQSVKAGIPADNAGEDASAIARKAELEKVLEALDKAEMLSLRGLFTMC
jgi:hypothetical protein